LFQLLIVVGFSALAALIFIIVNSARGQYRYYFGAICSIFAVGSSIGILADCTLDNPSFAAGVIPLMAGLLAGYGPTASYCDIDGCDAWITCFFAHWQFQTLVISELGNSLPVSTYLFLSLIRFPLIRKNR